MENEIVVETIDIGRYSNPYRGERALVCAIIREPGMVADPPKAEFTDDIPF